MAMIQNVGTVDQTGQPAAEPASGGALEQTLGRDAFMRLLVAQLEQQDPLDPQGNAEFVAQLATFSSLEQLVGLNDRVDAMISGQTDLMLAQSQMLDNQALGMVDRELLVASDGQLYLTENGAEPVVFELPEDYSSVRLEISDPVTGEVVRTIQLDGQQGSGRHEVVWDGEDDTGQSLDPGPWGFRVVAIDEGGRESTIAGLVRVRAEGIHYGAEGQRLFAGPRQITFPEIVEILGS